MAKTTQYDIKMKEEVTAQLRNIEAKLKETNASMATLGKTAKSTGDLFKFDTIGRYAAQGAQAIASFVQSSIKAFGDYEEALLRMEAQLKVSGSNLGLSFGDLKRLANDLEGKTGIDDGDFLKGISLLQTFTNVRGKVFEQALAQAGNLSVVFGDVETASKQLGMALDNPIENLDKLKKASISFTDAEKARYENLVQNGHLDQAQLEILEKVREKFDGLAESVNQGVNGSLRNLANAWDDTMKGLGSAVATYAKPAIDLLTQSLNKLNADVIFSKITPQQEAMAKSIFGKVQGLGSIRDPKKLSAAQAVIDSEISQLEKTGYDLTTVLNAVQTQRSSLDEATQRLGRDMSPEGRQQLGSAKESARLKTWEDMLIAIRSQYDTIGAVRESNAQKEANDLAQKDVVQKKLAQDALDAENRPNFRGIASDALKGEGFFQTLNLQVAIDRQLAVQEVVDAMDQAGDDGGIVLGKALLADNSSMADSVAKLGDKLFDNPDMDASIKNWIGSIQSALNSLSPLFNQIGSLFSTLNEIQRSAEQAELDSLRSNFDEWKSLQELKIGIAKSNGEETNQIEQDLANESYARNQEIREKEREVKKKAWEAEKQAKLSSILMSTSQAVVQAYAGTPFPWSIPLAIAVGGLGLAQFGAVANQPMPAFTDGGIVPGFSRTGDKILSRLNSGEMVLNSSQQTNLFRIANGEKSGSSAAPNIYQIGPVYGKIDDSFLEALTKAQARYEFVGA